jgi:hypothetical protein
MLLIILSYPLFLGLHLFFSSVVLVISSVTMYNKLSLILNFNTRFTMLRSCVLFSYIESCTFDYIFFQTKLF